MKVWLVDTSNKKDMEEFLEEQSLLLGKAA